MNKIKKSFALMLIIALMSGMTVQTGIAAEISEGSDQNGVYETVTSEIVDLQNDINEDIEISDIQETEDDETDAFAFVQDETSPEEPSSEEQASEEITSQEPLDENPTGEDVSDEAPSFEEASSEETLDEDISDEDSSVEGTSIEDGSIRDAIDSIRPVNI